MLGNLDFEIVESGLGSCIDQLANTLDVGLVTVGSKDEKLLTIYRAVFSLKTCFGEHIRPLARCGSFVFGRRHSSPGSFTPVT